MRFAFCEGLSRESPPPIFSGFPESRAFSAGRKDWRAGDLGETFTLKFLGFSVEVWYGPHQNMSVLPGLSRVRAAEWPECFPLPEKERIQEDHIQRSFLQTSSKEFTACLLQLPPLAFLMSCIKCSIVLSVKQLETKWTQLVGEWLHKLWQIHTTSEKGTRCMSMNADVHSPRLLPASHWARSIPDDVGFLLTGNISLGTSHQSGWGFLRTDLQTEVHPLLLSQVLVPSLSQKALSANSCFLPFILHRHFPQ